MGLRDLLEEHHNQLQKELELMSDVIQAEIADLATVVGELTTLISDQEAQIANLTSELATANNAAADATALEAQITALKALLPKPVPEALVVAPSTVTATAGTAVTDVLVASGGTPPYTFASTDLAALSLAVDSAGNVSGTGTAGTATITVTDSATPPAEVSVSVTVA